MKPLRAPFARLVAAFAASLLVAALMGLPASADTKSELAAAKAKLTRLVDQIASTQKALEALQAQANDIASQIDAVQSRIAIVDGDIANVQTAMRKAGRQLMATEAQLDERIRLAYETGPAYGLELILGSSSLSDLTDRLAIVSAATNSDHQLILQIQSLQAGLRLRQQQLTSLESELSSRQADLSVKETALQSKQKGEQQALDQLDKDRSDAAALVKQLEAKRAAEIAAYKKRLAELAAARAAASHGGASIGAVFFVCPVDQPRSYSDDFGAPRYTTNPPHPHAGNDILAPLGTPIRATFDGDAVVSTNDLGGLSVSVYGAAGYTYNAHLSALGHLGQVSTGTIIGYVGNSGDAAGGPTHDHFEWHPNVIPSPLWVSPYGYSLIGTAIDPYPYLNSVC